MQGDGPKARGGIEGGKGSSALPNGPHPPLVYKVLSFSLCLFASLLLIVALAVAVAVAGA